MRWRLSWRADPAALPLADRHYNRQKVGSPQFVPPGRCLVLTAGRPAAAVWVTSWPLAQYVGHEWGGRGSTASSETRVPVFSSDLIREALAATRWCWPEVPELGMVTFVDAGKVRAKRDPGYCYLCAGFERIGVTKGGLIAFGMAPARMPEAAAPEGVQFDLLAAVA